MNACGVVRVWCGPFPAERPSGAQGELDKMSARVWGGRAGDFFDVGENCLPRREVNAPVFVNRYWRMWFPSKCSFAANICVSMEICLAAIGLIEPERCLPFCADILPSPLWAMFF